MSELRLALPECKYKNNADELLKDQFIFGIDNKEIQDHLLGEISETDNSVRALYEVCKIGSKLAQRRMLGTVNPSSLGSMDAVKRGKNSQFYLDCKFCGRSHNKGECPAFGKLCNACGGKKQFKAKCIGKRSDRTNGRKRSNRTNGRKCTHRCNVHEIEECHDDDNSVENLMDQVQSLFYQ